MHRVQTNAELEARHSAGAGFIFNDFTSGPAGAQDNVLHVAGCMWVGRMLDRAEPARRPSVRKMFFATLDEAQSWLGPNRGPEGRGWKQCATCRPDRTGGGRLCLQAVVPSPAARGEPRDSSGVTGSSLASVRVLASACCVRDAG